MGDGGFSTDLQEVLRAYSCDAAGGLDTTSAATGVAGEEEDA